MDQYDRSSDPLERPLHLPGKEEAQAVVEARLRGENVRRRTQNAPWFPWVASGGFLSIGVWFFVEGGWIGASLSLLFACLLCWLGFSIALDRRRAARVARVMSESVPERQSAPAAAGGPRVSRPVRVDAVASVALPPVKPAEALGETCNALGRRPSNILYLCNFHAAMTGFDKAEGGWSRFGPVSCLLAPSDLGLSYAVKGKVDEIAALHLITTPEAFESRLKEHTALLLPPGTREVRGYAHFTGGWKEHHYLCSDAMWQYGVRRLLGTADFVVVDASDYTPARGGLTWEIQEIIDRMPLERVLVLSDVDADLLALRQAFEQAGQRMRVDSPNNKDDEAVVRMVVYPSDSDLRQLERATLAGANPPDPAGLIAASNWFTQQSLHAKFLAASEQDRAMAHAQGTSLDDKAVGRADACT